MNHIHAYSSMSPFFLSGVPWSTNRDLRNRLLSDFPLRCGTLKNSSKRGRIYFRSVSIFVPEIAELRKEVRVLCDLSPESSTHPTPCATEATSEDPARRLGIRITYSNKDTSSFDSQWCQQSGGRKIRVLNSLVDFLVEKMKNVPRVDCDVSYWDLPGEEDLKLVTLPESTFAEEELADVVLLRYNMPLQPLFSRLNLANCPMFSNLYMGLLGLSCFL